MPNPEPTLPAASSASQDGSFAHRGLTRKGSAVSLAIDSMLEKSTVGGMSISQICALRQSILRRDDAVAKIFMASKESLEKRAVVESAYRLCKEAFLEVAAVLIQTLDKGDMRVAIVEEVKMIVSEALKATVSRDVSVSGGIVEGSKTYSSAAASTAPKIQVSKGPVMQVPNTTSFFIEPTDECAHKFASSLETKDVMCKALKPSAYGLKINRVTLSRNKAVRVEATTPDISRLKTNSDLANAGLRVVESVKTNPRLIVFGVPLGMSPEEIKEELLAQNFDDVTQKRDLDLKIIYTYPVRTNSNSTSCVIEVSPQVRNYVMRSKVIYLRFSAYRFADHVRIIQCYKCLSFGHFARECRSAPACGRCAGDHETRGCTLAEGPVKCRNCLRGGSSPSNAAHAAIDATNCPILARPIKDRITNINYG